jgi:predicted ATPase
VDGMILISIANQMRHCISDMANGIPESKIDLAKLYVLSGKKAMGGSDYATSRLYLKLALSLLPTNCWEMQFELSHQISLRMAKSVYSCGDVEEAQSILQDMLDKCRSFEDKVPVQAMLVTSECNRWYHLLTSIIC